MMRILIQRVVSILLGTALSSVATPAAEIRGRILGDGGKPVAHALVRVVPNASVASRPAKAARAETGDDGGFVAQGIDGELFRVRVEAKGYAPLTQPDIPAEATVQLRLQWGADLSGIVKDRSSGAPIAGASVLAWEKEAEAFGEEAYRKATSGKDGRFVVSDLPKGKVTVEAKAAGRAPLRSANIAIPKSALELLLDPAGGLTGRITNTLGDPVAGAHVKASWRGTAGAKSRSATTDADGRYRIADADTMSLTRIAVGAAKFLLAEREGPAPEDGVLDFVLEHGGSIAGSVRGYDGKTPPSFRVKVRAGPRSSRGSAPEREFTDPGGAFRVDDLEPGTYTIEVAAERYASVAKSDFDVVAEQVADAGTLTLASRSVLRGRVVAARDGSPVAGASVHVALVDGREHPPAGGETSWSATTAADGTFQTPDLPEGEFDVALEHPQFAPARTRVAFRPGEENPELALDMYRGGALTGTVLDVNLDPVQGVHIAAAQGTEGDARLADTGPDGRYFVDGLAPGTYTVTRQPDRPGNAAAVDTKLAVIREGETTTVDFDEKARILVSGVLKKGDRPIPSAQIYFVPTDVNVARKGKAAQSDDLGGFQIGLRRAGRYRVSVVFGTAAASRGHNVVTLTIPDQPEVHQDIVFNVQAISGRVVDPDRKGLKGAMVTALRDGVSPGDSPGPSTTIAIDDGVFRLDAIDPGTYRVTARARGYAAAEAYPVSVREDAPDPEIDLCLGRGWILRGRLLDPQGRGVSGALVVVAPAGAAESGYLPTQTDGSGSFRITAPADSPISIAAISANFAPAVQTGIEPPGDADAPDVVLHADAGGALRVRVVHRGGEPVPGAMVAFQPMTLFPGSDVVVERNRPRSTDVNGVTRVTLLYPGTYLVALVGRKNVAPIQVGVGEGTESEAVFEVP